MVGPRLGLSSRDAATRISHLFLNGWPHHPGTPWINLNVARFHWRLVRALESGDPQTQQRRRTESASRLRVGCLANLNGSLTFTRPLLENAPEDVSLYAFDLGGSARPASYLVEQISGYYPLSAADPAPVAAAIRDCDLDVLVCDVYRSNLDAMLDAIDTPCVVDLCSTAHLRFNEHVAFHIYTLQQADYVVRRNRLFCATSESLFDRGRVVFPGYLFFERRGLDPERRAPWRDRDPLLVYHGKLYKVSDDYLACIFGLLAADRALEFVLVGRDEHGAVDRIQAAARRAGVVSQVHYDGDFRVNRNEDGEIDDPSWRRLAETLSRARLAPDPWPLGGGYSRVEAFAAGACVPHLGVRSDSASWRKRQPAVTADHPVLEIASSTVYSQAAYQQLCERCLYDGDFADALAAEQAEVAIRVTDPARYWNLLLSCYREWACAA